MATNHTGEPYRRRFPFPKWSRLITVLDEPLLFRRLPEFDGWTKATHTGAAREYAKLASVTDDMYRHSVQLMVQTYGDGSGVLISGCYREHFPDSVKDSLRTLAHQASDYSARSAAHWRFAGKRLNTWRAMRETI